MMQHMATYSSSNITTELIQKSWKQAFQIPTDLVSDIKVESACNSSWYSAPDMEREQLFILSVSAKYLDENKQLILAILDNQNLGKPNECATYQAKLQQNLMYLAAIADAQPQGGQSSQMQAPAPSMQPAQHYMQQQQQLQMMAQRNTTMIPSYLQQSQQASQQSFYSQQSLLSGGGGSFHMMTNDRGMGGNGSLASPNYSDGGRDGNPMGMTMQGDMHGGGGADLGDGGNSHGNDDSEASYLKGSDGSSL